MIGRLLRLRRGLLDRSSLQSPRVRVVKCRSLRQVALLKFQVSRGAVNCLEVLPAPLYFYVMVNMLLFVFWEESLNLVL